MNRKAAPPVGIGVITIFTVLLVLTLSVFSALTLTSARADLALSKINADTVSDYYAADAEAVQRYNDFAAGTEAQLDETIEMNAAQSLRICLVREDGQVKILAWQTVPAGGDMDLGEETLPVWDGTEVAQ